MCPEAPRGRMDVHEICCRGHLWQFFVIGWGMLILMGSKIPLSHLQSHSPLTQGSCYRVKYKSSDGRHLRNIEKSPNLSRGSSDFDEILYDDCSDR